MNKIFKISIVTALSSFLLVGCSGTPDAPDSEAAAHESAPKSSVEIHAAKMHAHYTHKKLGAIIKKAGEDAGWKMTEFKENAFVAEKSEGDKTISTTVKF